MESSRKYWTLGANYSTALYIQNDFQPPTISQPTTNYIPTSNHSMQILWNTDEATASTMNTLSREMMLSKVKYFGQIAAKIFLHISLI